MKWPTKCPIEVLQYLSYLCLNAAGPTDFEIHLNKPQYDYFICRLPDVNEGNFWGKGGLITLKLKEVTK